MFKITGSNLKVTFAATEEIAMAVMADYKARDIHDLKVEPYEMAGAFHLDFGGMLLSSFRAVEIGGLSFFPHQVDGVMQTLRKAEIREGGYVKLHGRHNCMCISPSQRDEALRLIGRQRQDLEDIADRQYAEWEKSLGGQMSPRVRP
jgi:hypothetical protein